MYYACIDTNVFIHTCTFIIYMYAKTGLKKSGTSFETCVYFHLNIYIYIYTISLICHAHAGMVSFNVYIYIYLSSFKDVFDHLFQRHVDDTQKWLDRKFGVEPIPG